MVEEYAQSPAKRRRLSLLQGGLPLQIGLAVNVERKQDSASTTFGSNADKNGDEESVITISSTSKLAGQTVAPFLAKHIPDQYAPLGGPEHSNGSPTKSSNTKYCYRHQPDLKCRRQANEPTMDELQHVSFELYRSKYNK